MVGFGKERSFSRAYSVDGVVTSVKTSGSITSEFPITIKLTSRISI